MLEKYVRLGNPSDLKTRASVTTPQADNRGMALPGYIVPLVCWKAECGEDLATKGKYDIDITKIRLITPEVGFVGSDMTVTTDSDKMLVFSFWGL
jgi:hypothetical protein